MKKLLVLVLILISVSFSGQILFKKDIPFNVYVIKGTIFELDAFVIVSKDLDRVAYLTGKIVGDSTILPEDFLPNRGMVISTPTFPPVLWIEQRPVSITDFIVLNHEIMHLVCAIMRFADTPLSEDTEEVWAYTYQYYSKEIYMMLSNK